MKPSVFYQFEPLQDSLSTPCLYSVAVAGMTKYVEKRQSDLRRTIGAGPADQIQVSISFDDEQMTGASAKKCPSGVCGAPMDVSASLLPQNEKSLSGPKNAKFCKSTLRITLPLEWGND